MIRLTPPTRSGLVSSAWGADRSYRGGWHEGLDFPGNVGDPVFAAADGKVVRVDNSNDSFAGHWQAIDHGGIVSRYLHATKNLTRVGQTVKRGEQIATLGTTGTVTAAPHVHFDVKARGSALAEYIARYGTPITGFGANTNLGRGVPAEPLMDGATYSARAKQQMHAAGVSPRGTIFNPTWLAAGLVVYLAYRYL